VVVPLGARSEVQPVVVRVLPGAEWGAPVEALLALLEVEVALRLALALRPVWAVSDRSLA
jgi:hypothetical protein